MKFSTVAVTVFAAVAAAVPTVDRRATETVTDLITGLTSQVKQLTGHMNTTLAALPQGASTEERNNAIASVSSDLTGIADLFHYANTQLAAVPASKRDQPTLGDLPTAVLGQLNGQPIVLAKLLLPLLQELNPALESVLETLSLGEVYYALHPLLYVELPSLVTNLSSLVQGLLSALSPLLAGLGGLLGPLLIGLGL